MMLQRAVLLLTFFSSSLRGDVDYGSLKLVDSVECATDTTHDFVQYPDKISRTETILGEKVRSLPNDKGEMKYFAYRLGKNKDLQADRGYFIRLIYPQDKPRSIFVLNRGCETHRGFHTGTTLGDGRKVPYINSNPESLDLPLSGKFESWDMLFYLQERFPDLKHPRDTEFPRNQTPADGFWVFCLQLSPENDPLSAGVAVKRIELYEAPPLEKLTQPLADLPEGLPKRHLFWREEMSDNVVASQDPKQRGFLDEMSWYEQKFRLMQHLGMRTFSKDLLEFGANQGWDSTKHGGNKWVYQSKSKDRWSRIVKRCGELDFDLLPYYEYAGSKGSDGLGFKKLARPLKKDGPYTHIPFAEVANVDLTDPRTFEDFRKMLEITVIDEKNKANFIGIWLRQRVSDLPASFADATLARFSKDSPITREQLIADKALYQSYLEWWQLQRRSFLEKIRDYLRQNLHVESDLLFTTDNSEAGMSLGWPNNNAIISEDPTSFAKIDLGKTTVKPLAEALEKNWQLTTLTSPTPTWGKWEWQHSVPHSDPANYKNTPGIFLTQTVNRAYTADREAFDAFRSKDGLAAIRHYSLNEDATEVGKDKRLVGYFVADVDYAAPFVMLPEALSFAHGDPHYFGYLASNNFNRGNPDLVRRFNANFLALPALPSVIDIPLCLPPGVVMRRIKTPKNGTYLGLVNISKKPVEFTLNEENLHDAVTGKPLPNSDITLAPCELKALHLP